MPSTRAARFTLREKHLRRGAELVPTCDAQSFIASDSALCFTGFDTGEPPEEAAMNVLYNSDNYYVVEFPGHCGVELVDKHRGRGAFLEGAVETKFRASMADLVSQEQGAESVDEFLGHYDALLTNRVILH
jgi:uncharacterized protein DUF3567